jgi:hypothetical protein
LLCLPTYLSVVGDYINFRSRCVVREKYEQPFFGPFLLKGLCYDHAMRNPPQKTNHDGLGHGSVAGVGSGEDKRHRCDQLDTRRNLEKKNPSQMKRE